LFNQTPRFRDTTAPTNIIWENRHIKGISFFSRMSSAMLIIIFMLSLAFVVIFTFKQAQITNQKKWPSIDCDLLNTQYTPVQINDFADNEFFRIAESKGKAPMMGALKCKCIGDIKAGNRATGYYDTYNRKYSVTDPSGASVEE